MYRHLFVFTDDDRATLREQYHGLMQSLEAGKAVGKLTIDKLTETMRGLLEGQNDLRPFWEQVRKNPEKSWHLHLMHPDKELLNLPWQLAIDPQRYPSFHLSKGPLTDTAFPSYHPQPGPLRILVMIASPDDVDYDRRLSYEEEEEMILKALSPLLIAGAAQVHFAEDGSLETLRQKLQLEQYHILYFSGHGIYKNDSGYLLMEDPVTLRSEEVRAEELARVLREDDRKAPPLIVLSSCQTAQGRMEDGFRGVADQLIHEGVPAVIAMAFSIKDQFNILFVGHLYEHLANKRSLPESYSNALQDMRQQEQQQLDRDEEPQLGPSQWLIPQLYLSQAVDQLVDWSAAASPSTEAPTADMPTDAYRFIGRRRECAALLNELLQNKPVTLTGQAGIGKTALAGYLMKRLGARDAAYHGFIFDESTPDIASLVTQMVQYLKVADPQYEGPYDPNDLVARISKLCKPVWIFDNLESYEYAPLMNFVHSRLFSKYPVLLLGRYEIVLPEPVFGLKLNEAPFVDFYRKYLELPLRGLHEEMQLSGPVEIASLLYRMFGGSYRTLEFLNEVYVNNPERTRALLQQISQLKEAEKPARELMKDVHQKLETASRQLVIAELLSLLNREEQKTLHLLLYFDRPVLPLALEMQQAGKNFDADLQRLRSLTLIEEQVHKPTGRKLYTVAPLIKNSVEGIALPQIYFFPEYAGDYFFKAAGEHLKLFYDDLELALRYYKMSRTVPKLNEAGVQVTNAYYSFGLLDKTLYYGGMVEELAGDKTAGDILNNIGLVHLKYNNPKQALVYFTRFSITARKDKDDEKLAIAFNAIGQTHVQMRDFDTALDWFEKSVELSKKNDFTAQEALTLSNIGLAYCDLREYEEAMTAFRESLRIRKAIGDKKGQANTLNNITRIYGDLGDLPKVKETLREALALAIEIGDKRLQGALLNNLGFVLMEDRDLNAALICFQQDLAIAETTDDEEEKGKALMGMGLAYKQLGKHNEAIEYITRGAHILQKFDYPHILSDTTAHLEEIYTQQK